MKKALLFLLVIATLLCVFCACGNTEDPQDTPETKDSGSRVKKVTDPPETTKEFKFVEFKLPEGVKTYQKFAAPTQNPDEYRKVARDYMYSMFDFKWKPAESFTIKWKNQGDFGVNLSYSKSKTYYGVPYSNTTAPLCEFTREVAADGTYKYGTYYFEETIGNHCSSSMVMAYQQLIDLPLTGSLKPCDARRGLLEFPTDLKEPAGTWISETLFQLNGKEKIFEAYAALDQGDILYKNISGSGHTRMVDKVSLSKNADGTINYNRSYIETIEQTNQFDLTRKDGINTTWWIDHKYTFNDLFTTKFMPVTLCIYHTKDPLNDAYIWLEGTEATPDNILEGLLFTINSNFPMSFAEMTITNEKGEEVKHVFHYNLNSSHSESFRKEQLSLKLNELPAGKYNYKLEAGIARGCCTLQEFEFTVK